MSIHISREAIYKSDFRVNRNALIYFTVNRFWDLTFRQSKNCLAVSGHSFILNVQSLNQSLFNQWKILSITIKTIDRSNWLPQIMATTITEDECTVGKHRCWRWNFSIIMGTQMMIPKTGQYESSIYIYIYIIDQPFKGAANSANWQCGGYKEKLQQIIEARWSSPVKSRHWHSFKYIARGLEQFLLNDWITTMSYNSVLCIWISTISTTQRQNNTLF
jgi:hypothetical protein